ncbi:MAG: diguanylate cyclase domain-containing protein, partial [Gemmatimonadota bacterium]
MKSPTAVSVLFGVLLAGTAFYLVPALALDGQALTATMAALVWLGLLGLWLLHRRELRQAAERVVAERRAHRFYRALLEHGVEAHLVLNRGGTITFASENARRVLGLDPEQLTASDRLVDLVRASDRRRALRAFAAVRRQPGSSLSLELGAMHGDGSDCHLHVRVANLSESGSVGGLLVTIRDITPRKAFESEIQHLAYYDALTGLANRRFFLEQGQKALSLASRHNLPAALFYLDLDRFKQVNDILGHEHGDDLLKQVARALQRVLRETDLVTRLGGDEFAVLLTEVRDVESAGRVANRILDAMPVVVSDGRHDVPIGTS